MQLDANKTPVRLAAIRARLRQADAEKGTFDTSGILRPKQIPFAAGDHLICPDEGDRMSSLILAVGNRLLACHRRLFEKDEPRFFVGEVLASNDAIIKASGFSFSRDLNTSHIVRKDEPQTKIIPVIAGVYLLYLLPDDVSIEHLRFVQDRGRLVLTDQARFRMDLTEHGQSHRI